MPWLKRLEVVFEDCDEEIAQARNDFPRFDDGLNGLVWLLERNARPVDAFPSDAAGSELIYGFSGDADLGIPDMWVFYRFDDEKVTILGINAMKASKGDE
jgi:hypothetical protein